MTPPTVAPALSDPPHTENEDWSDLMWTRNPAIFVATVGIAGIIVFAASPWRNFTTFLAVSSAGVLIAGSALLCGAILGFLFGIPRTLQGNPGPDAKTTVYLANTNLEQISDWLTKIIIGVGLVELGTIPGKLMSLNDYLATALGRPPGGAAFAGAVVVFWLIFGFLLGYLWTRLFLPSALRRAERETIREVARQAAREVNYESTMFAKLYEPQGYEEVIKLADEMKQRQVTPTSDRIWLYIACAWGQKLTGLNQANADQAEISNAKANALAAVRKVVEINPAQKQFLRGLSDPAALGLPLDDNDLAALKDDPEFKKLVS